MKLTLYTDGASKGNPGDAGIGVVITANGGVVKEIAEYIGRQTNNVAEYSALIAGLTEAAKLGATELEISTDSELMARQLTGLYKVKSPRLKPLHDQVIDLLRCFAKVRISHVMREFNKRADELANEGIRKHKNRSSRASQPETRPTPKQRELGF